MLLLRATVFAVFVALLGCGSPQGSSHPRPLPPPESLEADTRLEGYLFAEGTELQRDHDGRLVRGTIAEERTVAGVNLPPGTVLWFDRGTVLQARPPTAVSVGGIEAEAGAPIRFPQPGVWDSYELCLARPSQAGAATYPSGVFVNVKWSPGGGTARVVGRSDVERLMDEVGLETGCR